MSSGFYSQDLKSGCSKCAVRPAQMNSAVYEATYKTIFFQRWTSKGRVESILAKSLHALHSLFLYHLPAKRMLFFHSHSIILSDISGSLL